LTKQRVKKIFDASDDSEPECEDSSQADKNSPPSGIVKTDD